MAETPTPVYICNKCNNFVTLSYEDSVKTKFYKCPQCGIVTDVRKDIQTKAELKKVLKEPKNKVAVEIDQTEFYTHSNCEYYLTLDCPIAAKKSRAEALELYSTVQGICHNYKKKSKIKLEKELEMKETLDHLYEKYIFVCPTDTEEILGYEDGQYVAFECVIKHELETLYGEDLKRVFVEEVLAHIQRANYIKREEINKFRNKIPLQNGLFDFETKEIEHFDVMARDQIYTYKLNVEYDPKAKCPIFLKFVNQILRKADVPLLQEIMGYCLLPAMPIHKTFWFYGVGRNGKGRVIATLEFILGKEENCSGLDIGEFKEGRRFSLCQLYGKLLNVSNEPQLSKYGIQTNVLKKITGEDTIHAELKGRNKRVVFKNIAKPIILGNKFPKVEDPTVGWWERVECLNFPKSFTGKNLILNIEKTWLTKPEEVSGIFNWMLEGLCRLLKNKEFRKSKTSEETKTEYMRVSDPYNAWLIDCCVFLPVGRLTRQEAYNNYRDYADELGATPDSPRVFYSKMRQTPKVKDTQVRIGKDGKRERVFQGITLKSEIEEVSQSKLDIDVILTSNPKSVKERISLILILISQMEKEMGMVPQEKLLEKLQNKHHIPRIDSIKIINLLLKDGVLFAPRENYVKKT